MKKVLAGAICAAVSTTAWAATPSETRTFQVSLYGQFDYSSLSYVPINVPQVFNLSVAFPSTPVTSTDYGTTTITMFGGLGDTLFSSPLTHLAMPDPIGNGLADLGKSAYTFADTNDYDSRFISEVAAQDNIYHAAPNGLFWAYHIEIRVQKREASLGGSGSADYGFTLASRDAFLNDFALHPENYTAIFNESWEMFQPSPTGVGGTYLGGLSFSGTAVAAPVQEPSEWAMITIGALVAGGFARRRKFDK